ncbi:MAG: DUF2252 domain-containing protein [Pseudonocardia sp.]|nr:DUF2252 domain-containing protein [Pseudonocardia sp.]ODU26041.1 MAG: hypothetical protein ABS80_08360 [Pseudonocardia sp. SCN 72-51]ODV07221.1 MAG: hypothetical protein ABT15_09200 [Pseudonocardia sp. SCN 73-27]
MLLRPARSSQEIIVPSSERHVVLGGSTAPVDGAAFGALSRPAIPRAKRTEIGKLLRERTPRSSLAEWAPPTDRADVLAQLRTAHEGRVPELVRVRLERMAASPYGYLRGAAGINAADFATLPATGIQPVICGDAHVGNFGFYASPERDLVFDLNDFDESHPGAWEWDLRRLVSSTWVAGREAGASEDDCQHAVYRCVHAYRRNLRRLAEEALLARSYERIDADAMQRYVSGRSSRKAVSQAAGRARRRTSDRALPRFTTDRGGARRIVTEPPLITRPAPAEYDQLVAGLDEYVTTLPAHWARVVGGYHVVDIAHKVVGVGSVGLRAYLALCEGSTPEDVLFLQLKQARRSVVAPFVHGDSAWHAHQGQRVVEYQQALQTVSDPLLGWTTVGERQFYVRQFRDMKGAIVLDGIDAAALADYAAVCGLMLAKGHARTSGASMIAGYCGRGDNLERALCAFARRYADQTEADYEVVRRAVG